MKQASEQLSQLCPELTDNGLAFLHRCVDGVAEDPNDLRTLAFAVVDLGVAVEVLMKARLVREHWTLICADPDKASVPTMLAGTLKTVTPSQAVIRLEGVAGLAMKRDGHAARVEELAAVRNRVVHFRAPEQDVPALQAAIYRGLNFVLTLLSKQFRGQGDATTQEMVEESLEEISAQIGRLQGLVAERMASIEPDLHAADVCLECPRCHQPTLTLSEQEPACCAFCLWRPLDGNAAADEFVFAVLNLSEYEVVTGGGEWPVHDCPYCQERALVEGVEQLRPLFDPALVGAALGEPPRIAHWACLSCSYTAAQHELDRCSRCSTVMEVSDSTLCASCWSYVTAG